VATTTVAAAQTDGMVAWVHGNESATGVTQAGPGNLQTFATNLVEKDGDRWRMRAHHAQPIPQ